MRIMKVQITVDDELWRKVKATAAMRNNTIGEIADKAFTQFIKDIGVKLDFIPKPTIVESTPLAYVSSKPPVVYPDEVVSAHHKCAICHLSFPESEMVYHAKTLRWACNECAEKQV